MDARRLVLVIAGLTALANALLGVPWPVAIVAGLAVVVVGEGAGAVLRMRRLPTAAGALEGHPLSPRELEVAVLVARGLTSKEIGTRLGNEKGTVDKHIDHIKDKLDLQSRAQVAVWVVEHGLLPPAGQQDSNTNTYK